MSAAPDPGPNEGPTFPPLLTGVAAAAPFAEAQRLATEGCDGGTLVWSLTADRLEAALVLAPEVPLAQAAAMLPLCGVGFANALGALSPPEVGVHLDWDGGVRVNGALAGALRMAASGADPAGVPDWLAVGLSVRLIPLDPEAPGATPDQTSLYDEGCAEVAPVTLLESWARHTLTWIHRWSEDGPAPLHAEWRGLVHGLKDEVHIAGMSGVFLGTDEDFGMILKTSEGTRAIPLTALLTQTEDA